MVKLYLYHYRSKQKNKNIYQKIWILTFSERIFAFTKFKENVLKCYQERWRDRPAEALATLYT